MLRTDVAPRRVVRLELPIHVDKPAGWHSADSHARSRWIDPRVVNIRLVVAEAVLMQVTTTPLSRLIRKNLSG